jgi:MFS family permease
LARITPFYYGWIIVVVGGVSNAGRVASAVEVSSVFVPALVDEYGWSRTVIASGTSIGGVAVALVGPFVGRLIDRYGTRIVVPVGSLLVGIGCLTLARVESAVLFVIVYASVRMSGQALVQFPNLVMAAKWFEHRRGMATAALVGIGATGLIVAPVAVQAIISHSGIAAAWVALGVLALTLGIVPSLVLVVRRPEDIGLRPDGAERDHRSEAGPAAVAEPADAADWTLREALETRVFWLIAASTAIFSLSSTGVGFHQLSYYQELGISPGTTAAVVSSFAFGVTAGGMFWGWLADRVPLQRLLAVQYGVGTALFLALFTVTGPLQAFPISFGFGVLVGGSLALPTLLLAAYYGRSFLGAISGVLQMARGFSLGSGPLVAAVFYDVTGSYGPAFGTFAVLCLAAVVMIALARKPERALSPA